MVSAADAPAADAARPSVAVLLAGQIRSLAEPPVRRELLLNVVRPTGASVLAHLSPLRVQRVAQLQRGQCCAGRYG